MASFSTSHYFIPLTFLILFLKIQAFDPVSLFFFPDFEKGPKFESSFALYGNAKVINGGSELVLSSGSGSSSGSGKIMIRKQIKFFEGKRMELVSFSTNFGFSISLDDMDGLAFVMVPSGFEGKVFDNSSSDLRENGFKVISVEFSASRDAKNLGSAYCNVSINVGNSVIAKISNNFSINVGLSRGQKLHAWIDYDGDLNRLDVRLSQNTHSRPIYPLLRHTINFSNVWDAKEMFVGFRPVKGDSYQPCSIFSWSFIVGHFPYWMHSEPLNPLPKVITDKDTETPKVKARSDCLLRVLAAMIFGAGCGSLAAFVMLYVWTIFSNRLPVAPEEYVMQPVEFEYKKVNIVVDKATQDGKE